MPDQGDPCRVTIGSSRTKCKCPGLAISSNTDTALCTLCPHTIEKHGIKKEKNVLSTSDQGLLSPQRLSQILQQTKRIPRPSLKLSTQRQDLEDARMEANRGYNKNKVRSSIIYQLNSYNCLHNFSQLQSQLRLLSQHRREVEDLKRTKILLSGIENYM